MEKKKLDGLYLVEKIDSICIVGGGSAGWLAAAYFVVQLPQYAITLIESPTIPPIGVGESTLLTFVKFLERCGIESEKDFLLNTDATFKSGILFKDWTRKGRDIWHPFGSNLPNLTGNLNAADLYASLDEDYEFFLQCVLPYYETCVKKNKVEDIRAYHFNAEKVASYFKNLVSPNINYISANVTSVNSDGKNITSLTIGDDRTIRASLYIDCTGFKNIVSSHVEEADWVDKSKVLYCNAAVTTTIDYLNEQEKTPYTTCQCHEDGWIFKIPTWSRIGSGLLYNSDLLSPAAAERKFVGHWGAARSANNDFNHISFTPRYNRRNWRGNVVSIGLSSGFVEPLESSSIHLTTDNIQLLSGRLRKGFFTQADRNIVNSRMERAYEETFDFISLHYLNSSYDSAFWKLVKNEIVVPSTLQWRIERYQQTGSRIRDIDDGAVFAPHSWTTMMEGFHFRRRLSRPVENARNLIERYYIKNEKYRYKHLSTNSEIFSGMKRIN